MTTPLRLSFEIRCSPQHAFEVWTTRVSTWWPKDHCVSGDPGAVVVLERHLGGRIFERTPDGAEIDWGEVTAWSPPDRLCYLWHIGGDRGDATDVELTFVDLGSGTTRLDIVHTGWERLGDRGPALREANLGGWGSLIPSFLKAISSMEPMEEIRDGDTLWRFDRAFLASRWTCIWGRGCQGIGPERAEHLGLGCCSMGADLGDPDESRLIAALAATLDPGLFQHHGAAADGGVFSDGDRTNTRVIDGACIFLNRPGFSGGAGCALHLAALASGESPVDWKPSVCWQVPIKVDWEPGPDDTEIATVRRWERRDWGAEGETMAWCCTEGSTAYVGDRPVIESLAAEIEAIVGRAVHVELRRRMTGP